MTSFLTRLVPAAAAALVAAILVPGLVRAQTPDAPGAVTLTVDVSLPAADHATPRDWYFEVLGAGGELADAFTISTTSAAPAGGATRHLPAGAYTVAYVFNGQVAPECDDAALYALAHPATVTSSLNLDGTAMHTTFAFEACGTDAPSLGSVVQDTSSSPVSPQDASPDRAAFSFAAAAPAAPDTGTGFAPRENVLASWWAPLTALVASMLAATGGAALLLHPYRPR